MKTKITIFLVLICSLIYTNVSLAKVNIGNTKAKSEAFRSLDVQAMEKKSNRIIAQSAARIGKAVSEANRDFMSGKAGYSRALSKLNDVRRRGDFKTKLESMQRNRDLKVVVTSVRARNAVRQSSRHFMTRIRKGEAEVQRAEAALQRTGSLPADFDMSSHESNVDKIAIVTTSTLFN